MTVTLESTLTCPTCGFVKKEIMPTNACWYFYECSHCHTILRPKPGDCCVFVHLALPSVRQNRLVKPVAMQNI